MTQYTPSEVEKIVKDARNSVRGKALDEALKAFVDLISGENAKELREITIKQIRSYPVQFIIFRNVV